MKTLMTIVCLMKTLMSIDCIGDSNDFNVFIKDSYDFNEEQDQGDQCRSPGFYFDLELILVKF